MSASIFGGGFEDVLSGSGPLPPSAAIPRASNEVYRKSNSFEIE
jgi:hypothetical protein